MTRVLIISRECWRSDSNEGNVLTSLFSGQPLEFANIYCKPGRPDNAVCDRYFQLTDRMALDNILHRTPMGIAVAPETSGSGRSLTGEAENKPFYDFFRRHNWEIFYSAQEFLWKLANFKSKALAGFVSDFAPDVIFAPLCYSNFVLRLQRYVIDLANCPAATYIYDDLYSLRQFRFSPIYWLNRFSLRSEIRKTLPYYRLAYTMTEEQADEYQRMLSIPMKVLRKCATGPFQESEKPAHRGVRLIYAGGVYFGRDKTLALVADSLRKMKAAGHDARLDIYSSSPLSKKMRKRLNDGSVCFVHPVIAFSELQKRYRESDIALHVESFQKKYALMTRLSFSTKIVDCLASGCAVLAICPDINAGYRYLVREDAAVCIHDPREIASTVTMLVENPGMIAEFAQKARTCADHNHDSQQTKAQLYANLLELSSHS